MRKGTKEYRDLMSVFTLIFGCDELQFFGISDSIPEKVILPDPKTKGEKILKLSYSAIYDEGGLLEKLMCTAEDVTSSFTQIKKAEEDQILYQFISRK